MRYFNRFAPLQPLMQVLDGAAGAGGSQQGGTQGSQGAGQQGGSQGGASPISLSDDTPISHEGKTISWKEYRDSQYAPKSEVEKARQSMKAEITENLKKLAAQIKSQQGKPAPQQQQRVDPFAGVRDMPVVDGKTLASLAENGFGQLARAIDALQKQNGEMAGQLKKLQGGVGTIAKERASAERTGRVSKAIESLGEGFDVKDPFLNDIAQDLPDAWEFDKPEEFPKMLADRISAMEKFVTARNKFKLEQSKKRIFTRPGGSGNPQGPARFDPRTSTKQIADALFGVQATR